MDIEILYRPSYSLAVVKLAANEKIRSDSGAMVSVQNASIETKMEGGLFKALGRSLLGGESMFQNFWLAGPTGGEITLAPELPGDVFMLELKGETYMVQAGSFLASEIGIELNTKISMKAFVAAEGISMLEATGNGKLLLSSYGAIHEKVLAAGEKYTVDTSHLVAFDAGMNVERKTVGGAKSTFLSGEGLVVELTGPGKLMLQSRSQRAFLDWLIPQIPSKSS
ncbi:MAG: TIGR00266 family protein [Anaerolineae bacterium]|nr:TIGR00266 family protein [Anaerolineae bacterium]